MKVFLSWSGELSHKVAKVLRDWIPSVIQSVEPYLSSEDIDKGARWSTDIAKELEASSYGILCVTSENLDSAWLNFEAGALSKAFDKANVSPFLFDLKRSEIKGGPILQFQSTIFTKDDVKKLVKGINKACDVQCLDESRLDKVFDVWWPKLEEDFNAIKTDTPSSKEDNSSNTDNSSSEILEEILELVRIQQKLLRSPEDLLPQGYIEHIFKRTDKRSSIAPGAIEDLRMAWDSFNKTIDILVEQEEIGVPISIVNEHRDILSQPIDYIIRQNKKRMRQLMFEKDEI